MPAITLAVSFMPDLILSCYCGSILLARTRRAWSSVLWRVVKARGLRQENRHAPDDRAEASRLRLRRCLDGPSSSRVARSLPGISPGIKSGAFVWLAAGRSPRRRLRCSSAARTAGSAWDLVHRDNLGSRPQRRDPHGQVSSAAPEVDDAARLTAGRERVSQGCQRGGCGGPAPLLLVRLPARRRCVLAAGHQMPGGPVDYKSRPAVFTHRLATSDGPAGR